MADDAETERKHTTQPRVKDSLGEVVRGTRRPGTDADYLSAQEAAKRKQGDAPEVKPEASVVMATLRGRGEIVVKRQKGFDYHVQSYFSSSGIWRNLEFHRVFRSPALIAFENYHPGDMNAEYRIVATKIADAP